MKPAIQYSDLTMLEGASAHLKEKGFPNQITPFSELSSDDVTEWMVPANGGYVLFLKDEASFEDGMNCMGEFFGYQPE